MKKQLATLILMLIFGLSVNVSAQSKIETVVIKTGINCDHCKVCESCGDNIEAAIYKLKGIKRVDINDNEKTVTVAYHTQKVKLEDIKAAIAASGFDADDVKADPDAYARLDDCCKK